jgi:hypothetical protein
MLREFRNRWLSSRDGCGPAATMSPFLLDRLLKKLCDLISHFVAVVRIDSHSSGKRAECLLLGVGGLNRAPVFPDIVDANVVKRGDAVQNLITASMR